MSNNPFAEDGASQFGEFVPASPINPATLINPPALSFDPSSWPFPEEYLLDTGDHPGLALTTIPLTPKNSRPCLKPKGNLAL